MRRLLPIKGTLGFKQFVGSLTVIAPQYGYGITVVDLMIRQAALESGWGASVLAVNRNNFIGMRCVQVRKTTQSGCTEAGWGIYSTPADCARDLCLWYASNAVPKTGFDAALNQVVLSGYVTEDEAEEYKVRIKSIESQKMVAVLGPVGAISAVVAPVTVATLLLKGKKGW